jgi:23S rRNA (guanosine2251-2'-O)-methyltransferase
MAKRKTRHATRRQPAADRRRGAVLPAAEQPAGPAELWLYGSHAVLAALANPRRRLGRLLVTTEAAAKQGAPLESLLAGRGDGVAAERAPREILAQLLPPGAVHQGLALQTEPLAEPPLDRLLAGLDGAAGPSVLVALDQVTDPQNVGAILRSAAAFGAAAVLAPGRHAAPESGALAKAASGALEHLPYLKVGNLAQTLDHLKGAGFWIVGLAAEGARPIGDSDPGQRVVLVLGAEGSGLRRLTREHCDLMVRLPTQGPIGQLNVASAAAVALYELLGRRRA